MITSAADIISVVLFSFIEAQELIFLHRRDHNWWPGSTVKGLGYRAGKYSIIAHTIQAETDYKKMIFYTHSSLL